MFLIVTENQSSNLHLAVQREYPTAELLPMPENINASENARFSPLRNRDINSTAMSVHQETHAEMGIDVTLDQDRSEVKMESVFNDPHLECYDRSTSVNLSCSMQSTVPEPFGGNNKLCYLNMPGGSWGQQTKYLSHELNSAHYTQLRQDLRCDWSKYDDKASKGISLMRITSDLNCSLLNSKRLFDHHHFFIINKRFLSLSSKSLNEQSQKAPGESTSSSNAPEKETAQSKLKKAVKEYGSTVIVFHVGISLISLGMFYVLVSR